MRKSYVVVCQLFDCSENMCVSHCAFWKPNSAQHSMNSRLVCFWKEEQTRCVMKKARPPPSNGLYTLPLNALIPIHAQSITQITCAHVTAIIHLIRLGPLLSCPSASTKSSPVHPFHYPTPPMRLLSQKGCNPNPPPPMIE